LIEEHLTLQIRFFDDVTVNDSYRSDACSGEQICDAAAQRTTSDDQNASHAEGALAILTDVGKECLAVVAVSTHAGDATASRGEACGSLEVD
jgi:hypothetical protein